jgi:hypothetical protein
VSSDGILFLGSFVKNVHFLKYLNGRYTETQTKRKLRKIASLFSAKMTALQMEHSFVYEAQYLCHSLKTYKLRLSS